MSTFFMGVVAPGTIVLPVLAAVYNRKYWGGPEKYVFAYLVFSGVFNVIAKLTARENNLPLLHLYTVLEFCLLCMLFKTLLTDKKTRLFITSLMLIFPVFAIVYGGIVHSFFDYNALPRFLGSLTLTFLCVYFLIDDLATLRHNSSLFGFAAVTGLLIYFSTCSALFGLSGQLATEPPELESFLWNLHAGFMLLMYLIFTAAYLNLRKR